MYSDNSSSGVTEGMWWITVAAPHSLTLLFSVGSRESKVLLSTSPISSSDTLKRNAATCNTVKTTLHNERECASSVSHCVKSEHARHRAD